MFMRVVQMKINPDKLGGFRRHYDEKILPELQKVPGCLCASLMQSDHHPDEFVSMTLWDKQNHAESYEQGGLFQKLLAESRPFLNDSSEWKIQLTKDFTLEYQPVAEEPIVKSFRVVEQKNSDVCAAEEAQLMYMRIVSVIIKPEKLDEFKQLYRDEIIPALRAVKGCRYAYLSESIKEANEVFSVTIWDSKNDAENYESSGLFDELKEKVKHTFSELYQWKMALEKESSKILTTSDDLKVDYYSIVAGRSFQ